MKHTNKIEFYHGDWFKLYTRIEPGTVDLVLIDPPYGILDKQTWDRRVNLTKLEMTVNKVLKREGLFIVFCNLALMRKALDELLNFRLRSWHLWRKGLAQPISKMMPLPNAEFILVLARNNVQTCETTWNPRAGMPKGKPYLKRSKTLTSPTRRHIKSPVSKNVDGRRWVSTVLDAPAKCNLPDEERSSHPTQKPESLLRSLIQTYSNPGDLVVDGFAGSGSTLIAAIKENRRAWGCEIEENYYNETSARIKRTLNQCELFTAKELKTPNTVHQMSLLGVKNESGLSCPLN